MPDFEAVRHDGRRLGRRPPDPARPRLRLRDYLTGVVPAHPTVADHFSWVSDWGLYGNDVWGDCGPVSVANQRKLVTRYLTGVEHSVTIDDVIDLYRRSGNPNFNPVTDADDNGVEMSVMLSAVNQGGIAGVKCLGYASVDVSNLDEVRAAIAIFGSVLYGVDLEVSQQQQTDAGLWDYKPSGVWGGHAVVAGRYSSAMKGADVDVVTWGKVVGTTDDFARHQLQEAWVVIWPEHLGSQEFLQGVDVAALAVDYKAITGRDFPAVIPPPAPAPPPVPPPPAPGPLPPKPPPGVLQWLRDLLAWLERLFG